MQMKMISLKIFMSFVILCARSVITAPISVPVDNNYSYNPSYNQNSNQNYYDDISARRPNSYFNRLPPNANQVQVDDVADVDPNNEYDYDDQQTDAPVINTSNQQQSSNYNNNLYNNYLLTENRVKFKKKRRRIRRPCVPIQSFGSPLFSNRLKREVNYDAESGKTFNLFAGGYNPGFNYPPPYYQSQQIDNVKPQYDSQGSGQIQYQPYGGYPCIPISYGHRPGGGLFGGNGGGGGGGPLGFFGQGGLLDFASPQIPIKPSGIYQGSGGYPQTVIINRPPLFGGGSPSYNRPGSQQDSLGSGTQQSGTIPGFWGSVIEKLQEFV